MFSYTLVRWNRLSTCIGAAIWTLLATAKFMGQLELDDLSLILLLAFSVITPLLLPLIVLPPKHRILYPLLRSITLLQPFACLIGGVSLLLNSGVLAALTAVIWFLFTTLLALLGCLLLLQRGERYLPCICQAVALIYLPIGGIWFLLHQLDIYPLGFSQTTVLLTAVHFHFITLTALIMIGLTGYVIQHIQQGLLWKLYQVLAGCMLVNPLLVAAGITITQLTHSHLLESTSAVLLALCMILIAIFNLKLVIPATTSQLSRLLLLISSSAIIFTMLCAGAYALGPITRMWIITVPQMILLHGWVNALIFGFCGLLGWRLRQETGKA